jgi:uncharacterized zinc-type alcohol dehydrogenase-like protein
MDVSRVAPLLCAGITTYSPLRRWGVKPGDWIAVAGLGGLGQMAVKLAAAMGAKVTVLTTSPDKAEAARAFGASDVVVSKDDAQMGAARGRFSLIIDTIPVEHPVEPYLSLLAPEGTLCIVGQIGPLPPMTTLNLVFGSRGMSGSGIGGISETQEMLDFCAEHGVIPDIEIIAPADINQAWETLARGDTAKRFVIDMARSE